ncbi:hypothetical protein DQX05_22505 [Paenibacillus thiaminolyticus]|uniref:Uncharacterized protein n=1 Tax=Paenibacillus thiaminolyticus TaxID=49283 RepID=A0A3A3GD41_PANTH|nr:hypothetical protein DQX05_22505 [Paenibacillus thiaminolyticus]
MMSLLPRCGEPGLEVKIYRGGRQGLSDLRQHIGNREVSSTSWGQSPVMSQPGGAVCGARSGLDGCAASSYTSRLHKKINPLAVTSKRV